MFMAFFSILMFLQSTSIAYNVIETIIVILYHGDMFFFPMQEIAELYESEQNIEKAIDFYEKAADFFQNEEVTTSANTCKLKVAQFAAQIEQ